MFFSDLLLCSIFAGMWLTARMVRSADHTQREV